MPLTSAAGPLMAVYNYLKSRLGSDREKRDFSAESELLDALRHADLNAHKYIITLYMKSGRTMSGRIGEGGYDHESYQLHRGTLTLIPEREPTDGVFYEQIVIVLSQIEGFLLQNVAHASPSQRRMPESRSDASEQTVGQAHERPH